MNEEEQMKIVLDIADQLRGFEIAHSVFQGSCQKLFGYGMTRKEILELVLISEMAHQERQTKAKPDTITPEEFERLRLDALKQPVGRQTEQKQVPVPIGERGRRGVKTARRKTDGGAS